MALSKRVQGIILLCCLVLSYAEPQDDSVRVVDDVPSDLPATNASPTLTDQAKKALQESEDPQWRAERQQYVPLREMSDSKSDVAYEVVDDDSPMNLLLLETTAMGVFGKWPEHSKAECNLCQNAAFQIISGTATAKKKPILPRNAPGELRAYYKELFIHNLVFFNRTVVIPPIVAHEQAKQHLAAVYEDIDKAEFVANNYTTSPVKFRQIDKVLNDAIFQASQVKRQPSNDQDKPSSVVVVAAVNIMNFDESKDKAGPSVTTQKTVQGADAVSIANDAKPVRQPSKTKRFAQRRSDTGRGVDEAVHEFNSRWRKYLKKIKKRIKSYDDKPRTHKKSHGDDGSSSSHHKKKHHSGGDFASKKIRKLLAKERVSVDKVVHRVGDEIQKLRKRYSSNPSGHSKLLDRLRRDHKHRRREDRVLKREKSEVKKLTRSLNKMVKSLEKSFRSRKHHARFSARRTSHSPPKAKRRVEKGRKALLKFIKKWKKQLVSLRDNLIEAEHHHHHKKSKAKHHASSHHRKHHHHRRKPAQHPAVAPHVQLWSRFDAAMETFRNQAHASGREISRIGKMGDDRRAEMKKVNRKIALLKKMVKARKHRMAKKLHKRRHHHARLAARRQESELSEVSRLVDKLTRNFDRARMAARRSSSSSSASSKAKSMSEMKKREAIRSAKARRFTVALHQKIALRAKLANMTPNQRAQFMRQQFLRKLALRRIKNDLNAMASPAAAVEALYQRILAAQRSLAKKPTLTPRFGQRRRRSSAQRKKLLASKLEWKARRLSAQLRRKLARRRLMAQMTPLQKAHYLNQLAYRRYKKQKLADMLKAMSSFLELEDSTPFSTVQKIRKLQRERTKKKKAQRAAVDKAWSATKRKRSHHARNRLAKRLHHARFSSRRHNPTHKRVLAFIRAEFGYRKLRREMKSMSKRKLRRMLSSSSRSRSSRSRSRSHGSSSKSRGSSSRSRSSRSRSRSSGSHQSSSSRSSRSGSRRHRRHSLTRRRRYEIEAEEAVIATLPPPPPKRIHVSHPSEPVPRGLLGSFGSKLLGALKSNDLAAATPKWTPASRWGESCCSQAHCVMKPTPPCETDESKAFLAQCGSKDAILNSIRLRFASPKSHIHEISNKALALYRALRRQMMHCRWLWAESARENNVFGEFRNFQSSRAFVDLFTHLLHAELQLSRLDIKPGQHFVGAMPNQVVVFHIPFPFISRHLGKPTHSSYGFRGNVMVNTHDYILTREAYLDSHTLVYLPTSAELLDVAANQVIPISLELANGKTLSHIVLEKYVRYWCPDVDTPEVQCWLPQHGNYSAVKGFKPADLNKFSLKLSIVSPPSPLYYPVFGDFYPFEVADAHYLPLKGCTWEIATIGKKSKPQMVCEGWKMFAQSYNVNDPSLGVSLDDLAANTHEKVAL